jgi:hypothetical protein
MPCWHIDEKIVNANTQKILWLEGKINLLGIDGNKSHP